jgi:hypothetical protein
MYPEQVGQGVFHPANDYCRDWVKALALTGRQVTAVLRLWHGKAWVDGRSLRSLELKRLASVRAGEAGRIIRLTEFGTLVAAWLEDADYQEGEGHTLIGGRPQ